MPADEASAVGTAFAEGAACAGGAPADAATAVVGVTAWQQYRLRLDAPSAVPVAAPAEWASGDRVVFRNTAPGEGYGLVASVPLDDPGAPRALTGVACDRVDASPYALTGGLFSRSPQTVDYVSDRSPVGNLYVNREITGAMVGRQPFGGNRLSGTGTKAGGPAYLLQFVEPRVVTENTVRHGLVV